MPELTRVPFPWASWWEAAAATVQTTATGTGELASASALLPLINTVGRRGCTGWGGDAPRARKEARATRRAPRATWGCVGAGSSEGCGTRVLEPLNSWGARALRLPDRRQLRVTALLALETYMRLLQSPISHERANLTYPIEGGDGTVSPDWGTFLMPVGTQREPAGKPPSAPSVPHLVPFPPTSYVSTFPFPFGLHTPGRSPTQRL